MRDSEGFVRMRTLQCVVLFVFLLIGGRLAYIQLIDSRYNELAKANVLRHVVQYPPRGEVFDRNGEYLVQSRECYDLMVIYSEIDKKGFDTLRMCEVLGLSREKLEKELANARMRPRAPRVVTSYISKEDKLRFDECNFRGFYAVYRTVRRYPRKVGGNLLGFVGEVNADFLKRHPDYKSGDYVGMSGVESAYEPLLKGRKGVKIQEIDTHGAIKGSYMNGVYDSLPEPGRYLVSTIDARLQLLGEELMRGKVGAAVAIEPSTGEILMMVSSPTYDPDELVGRERGNNYMKMIYNKRHPLFSRAVKAKYPPGSTFKLVQGLIGLQEGVLRPSDLHVCHEGYQVGRRRMKCHAHASPLDLRFAVATSCNAYFCYVFRDILDNRKYESVKDGYDVWKEYVESFGFGRKLGSDFLDEGNGYVPDRSYYDRQYRGSWNSLTVIRWPSVRMRWAVRPCSWPISRPSSPTGATTTFRISSRRSRGRIRSTAVFTNATIPRSIPSTSNRSSTVCGGASTSAAPPRRRVWKDSTSAARPVRPRIPAAATTRPSSRSRPRTIRRSPFRSMSKTAVSALRRPCRSPVCWRSTT